MEITLSPTPPQLDAQGRNNGTKSMLIVFGLDLESTLEIQMLSPSESLSS